MFLSSELKVTVFVCITGHGDIEGTFSCKRFRFSALARPGYQTDHGRLRKRIKMVYISKNCLY